MKPEEMTVEKAQEILNEDKERRIREANEELNSILVKYNVHLEPSVILRPTTKEMEVKLEIRSN